jgi:hypothetical protein
MRGRNKTKQYGPNGAHGLLNSALHFAAMLFLDGDRQIGAEAFCSIFMASTFDKATAR